MYKLYYDYLFNFSEFPKIIKIAIRHTKNYSRNQIGGAIKLYQYDGYKFKVITDVDNELVSVTLIRHESDNLDEPICANILIDKDGECALQSILYMPECMSPLYQDEKGGGSLMLQFIIKLLKREKEKLGVKRLYLTDNSSKPCKNCPRDLTLSNMHTLLYGESWYGKYGFRPIRKDKKGETEELQFRYEQNKEIINRALVRDINLMDIIIDASVKSGVSVNKSNLESYLERNKDRLLKDVLKEFLHNYNKFCCLFEYMIEGLFYVLRLFNFEGKTFYIDI